MELAGLPYPPTVNLLGTPPLTPNSDVRSITPCSAPAAWRTPRKPEHPQRSTVSESKRDSVILSFKLVRGEEHRAPSLSISTTELESSREPRAKRRLFTSSYDTVDYSDLFDISRARKVARLSSLSLSRVQKSKCSPVQPDLDGTDADDEMEQSAFSANYLSPPYSPLEDSSTSDTSPPELLHSLQTQRIRGVAVTPKVKTCASCKTKKTPLWRDSDDGTPYCNACGIRFKKYHVRCSACFYIPRKDEKINNSCCLCGSRLVHCRHH